MQKQNMKILLKQVMSKPIAHRGLHDINKGIIENSASAFKEAIKYGYAIECDLQLTKDNRAVVFHDETLERVTEKTGKICDFNLSEIRKIKLKNSTKPDKIQSFEHFLRQINKKVAIAVELKPQSDEGRDDLLAKVAVKALQDYKGPIAFISFVPRILQAVKKYGFDGPTGIIVERFVSETAQKHISPFKRFILRHMLHYPKTKFDFVDIDREAFDLPAYHFFRALGFPTAAWTIKNQEQANEALKHCDQIAFEGFIPKESAQNE